MKNVVQTIFVVFVMLLVSSCSQNADGVTQFSVPNTQTNVAQVLEASLEPTDKPTSSPAPTISNIEIIQPTSTFMPSATVLPTFSTEQRNSLIANLVDNNGGCKLPCWWGITPGLTSWDEAHHFLSSFASEMHIIEGEDISTGALYYFETKETIASNSIEVTILTKDGVVQKISVRGLDNVSAYHLPQILETNGVPDEIWFHTWSFSPQRNNNHVPFSIMLFYPEQGIYLNYGKQESGEISGDIIHGCVQEAPYIELWFAEEIITIEETSLGPFNSEPDLRLLPIDDAIGMNRETFHHTFASSTEPVCVDTLRELWLGPFGEPVMPTNDGS